jgi:hypothetical protein
MYLYRNIEERSRDHFCREKAISIIQVLSISSVCFVVLFILDGERMHRTIPSCQLCLLWLYHIFSTLPQKWKDFLKKIIEHKTILRTRLKVTREK